MPEETVHRGVEGRVKTISVKREGRRWLLVLAQTVLARKKRGSSNRGAAREVVANRHCKVANQRRDFHHKLARHLVAGLDVLCVEALKIKKMTRSATGTVQTPGITVAA